MVRNNDYPKKNFQKDGTQASEPARSNSQPKTFQKAGETHHKENYTRNNNRPPRELPQKDNNHQKEGVQRDIQKKENVQRDPQHRENTNQRNYHRDNSRDNRESFRPPYQRPVIKPRTDETVEDIATDIIRIEKEIELEIKEIKSMRLGV